MAKSNTPDNAGAFDKLPDEVPQEQIGRITLRSWRTHLVSIRSLDKRIEKLIDDAVKQTLAQGRKLTTADIGRVFQRHPELRAALDKATEQLNADLIATIEQGSKEAWLRANATYDSVVATMAANNAQLAALLREGQNKPQNDRALRAFMQREMQGMKLSDRVWRATEGMKQDMERAVEVALAEGVSAQSLSKRVRELLKEPHRLYRRVRDKDGNLKLSQAAQKYRPGTGVYRSSYKNAMRVARTEVNMVYQASDSERWTKSWWVKGIRVSLSNNHTSLDSKGRPAPLVDICDELAGDYPADFKFTGWHPQCRCFATPITCSYTEIREYYSRKRAGEDMSNYTPPGTITEPPAQFKRWIADNSERLAGAAKRGTTPYFIANNAKYTGATPLKSTTRPQPTSPTERVTERQAKRTPDEIAKIQRRWNNNREYHRLTADPDYRDVEYNYNTGGLRATHKAHNFDRHKGAYEKNVQRIGYSEGDAVILGIEDHTKHKQRNTEGLYNNRPFEIAGAESGTPRNIRNALKHCVSKPDAEIAVVYLPNEITEAEIMAGLNAFNGLKGKKGQWRKFHEIIFMDEKGIQKRYRP